MQISLNTIKQKSVLLVNILFTLFCLTFPINTGIQIAWFLMWILVPVILPTHKALCCIAYMSLYMRILLRVKLFSIIIFISCFIILIKELLLLNKNKLLNKYFKILIFYSILIILPLFYSISINKCINISFIYYLNMINLLFLFYLLKNKLTNEIIMVYSYGIIVSSLLSIICFAGNLYYCPFSYEHRFFAFSQLCNTLGVGCIICIASIYVLLKNNKINKRLSIYLISILSLIGFLTLSKNFLITFAIVFLIILINEFKTCKNKKRFLKIIIITSICLSPIILYYCAIMFERFVTNKDGYTNIFDIATTGRLDKWLIYLTPWIKHFYSIPFGLGLGFNYNTPYSSHSFYIGYISKIGIVGFILLSIFIYLIVFHKNKSNLKFKYLPILIMFLICLVEDVSHNTFNFIPFIISIITLKYNNQTQQ